VDRIVAAALAEQLSGWTRMDQMAGRGSRCLGALNKVPSAEPAPEDRLVRRSGLARKGPLWSRRRSGHSHRYGVRGHAAQGDRDGHGGTRCYSGRHDGIDLVQATNPGARPERSTVVGAPPMVTVGSVVVHARGLSGAGAPVAG